MSHWKCDPDPSDGCRGLRLNRWLAQKKKGCVQNGRHLLRHPSNRNAPSSFSVTMETAAAGSRRVWGSRDLKHGGESAGWFGIRGVGLLRWFDGLGWGTTSWRPYTRPCRTLCSNQICLNVSQSPAGPGSGSVVQSVISSGDVEDE